MEGQQAGHRESLFHFSDFHIGTGSQVSRIPELCSITLLPLVKPFCGESSLGLLPWMLFSNPLKEREAASRIQMTCTSQFFLHYGREVTDFGNGLLGPNRDILLSLWPEEVCLPSARTWALHHAGCDLTQWSPSLENSTGCSLQPWITQEWTKVG